MFVRSLFLTGRTDRSSSFPQSSSGSSATTPRRRPCSSTDILMVRLSQFGLNYNLTVRFNLLNWSFDLVFSSTCRLGGWLGHWTVRSDQIFGRIEALRTRDHRWQGTGKSFSTNLLSVQLFIYYFIIFITRFTHSLQVLGWLHVIEAYQKTGTELPLNLKFCFEGMEESGSIGLDDFLVRKFNLLYQFLLLFIRQRFNCHFLFRWCARTTSSCPTSTTVASPTTTGWAKRSPASPTASEVSATSAWRYSSFCYVLFFYLVYSVENNVTWFGSRLNAALRISIRVFSAEPFMKPWSTSCTCWTPLSTRKESKYIYFEFWFS